jgi:hypothetical protein
MKCYNCLFALLAYHYMINAFVTPFPGEKKVLILFQEPGD